jgi:hypothetical protein
MRGSAVLLAISTSLVVACAELFSIEERTGAVCEPGVARCIDETREVCAADGSGYVADACDSSAPFCIDGGCVACAPDDLTCGQPTACEPASTRCRGGVRERCTADGDSFEPLGCDEDDTCASALFQGVGDGFTCLVTSCGSVYCWGRNDRAQLTGGVDLEGTTTPLRIGVPKAKQGCSGIAHSCVLSEVGEVHCWGDNIGAQSDAIAPMSMPVPEPTNIPLDAPAVDLECGTYHSCAILEGDGRVQCWGDPTLLKLGWNDTAYLQPPVPIDATGETPLTGAVDLALDRYTSCAVLSNGDTRCWGFVDFSGFYALYGFAEPVVAKQMKSADGGWQTLLFNGDLGLFLQGRSTCGGSGFEGNDFLALFPMNVVGAREERSGQLHTCLLLGSNVHCLGDNRHGQLGSGSGCMDDVGDNLAEPVICGLKVPTPTQVALPGPVVDLVARFSHTCALVADERELLPFCWGEGVLGELGNGTQVCSPVPVPVAWPPEAP